MFSRQIFLERSRFGIDGIFFRVHKFLLKKTVHQKKLTLKTDNPVSSGDQRDAVIHVLPHGIRLRQHCQFERFVPYLQVAFNPLISERNYPA